MHVVVSIVSAMNLKKKSNENVNLLPGKEVNYENTKM
jgi:hypothetical protein